MAQWNELPAELASHLLRFLPIEAIGAMPQACRSWRISLKLEAEVVDAIIRAAALQRFPNMMDSPSALFDVRDRYRKQLDEQRTWRRFKQWRRGQKLSEGRFGNSYIATHEVTGEVCTLKKVTRIDDDEGFDGSVLHEVSLVQQLGQHRNIRALKDVFYMPNENKLYLCFEYCEIDLKRYMKSQQYKLSAGCIQSLSYQMLSGLEWCHSHAIWHRDLKPQTLFVNPKTGLLKLAKFGLARAVTPSDMEPPSSSGRTYTLEVVTLWYRAPEILLGDARYSSAIDMWSIGCVLRELVEGFPFFPGDSEIDQLYRIFRQLGTPCDWPYKSARVQELPEDSLWPGVSQLPHFRVDFPKWSRHPLRSAMPHADRLDDAGVELVSRCLAYVPSARPTAREALRHTYFGSLDPESIGRAPLP